MVSVAMAFQDESDGRERESLKKGRFPRLRLMNVFDKRIQPRSVHLGLDLFFSENNDKLLKNIINHHYYHYHYYYY